RSSQPSSLCLRARPTSVSAQESTRIEARKDWKNPVLPHRSSGRRARQLDDALLEAFDVVEGREALELGEPLAELLPGDRLEPVHREALDREGREDAAHDHRLAHHDVVEPPGAG